MIKLGQIVLKGVNGVQNDKIRSNCFESSEQGAWGYNWVKWS